MSAAFQQRLFPVLPEIAGFFGTPFHVYDESGIRETGRQLQAAFAGAAGFREYFAVKALPNPRILAIMHEMGFGFDCSSVAELLLARRAGASGEDIMFTSNDTSRAEFDAAAADGGCILNLDDISLVDKVPDMPELVCFRYNPGPSRSGNSIIGNPVEAKYGVAHHQILDALRAAMARGARRFGLHTMLASNERNHAYMVQTVRMLLEIIEWAGAELAIRFEFINMGGGLGIPYRPDDVPFDLAALGAESCALLQDFGRRIGYVPRLYMESGRYITGPHGVLVTRVINRKDTYRTFIGVDACMSSLMRPGMYGAYHHIDVLGKAPTVNDQPVDVVGSLCENNDKFAIQRPLPPVADGDLLLIHDTGAHGIAMGFNYNGKLRPQELLLRQDGEVELIRRAETVDDYFSTLQFTPRLWQSGRHPGARMHPSGMRTRQHEIAAALGVVPAFIDEAALRAETARRIAFIKRALLDSGLKTLVLGISGGVDSLLAGRLAQLAVEALRAEAGDDGYRFIAVRLPCAEQHDEHDARAALAFVRADEESSVDIEAAVLGLAAQLAQVQTLAHERRDFVLGNIKARMRMVAQFAIANATNGLVIGTDHAAEAVMGFFTKFGDGACDITPLHGLVKFQIRAIAASLGAPSQLVHKVPTADLEALAPGKPDEAVHGVSYDDIDAFLHGLPVDGACFERIVRAYERSAHKRALPLVPRAWVE